MDSKEKRTRIKMGLLRQKPIEQSTEKTPLIRDESQTSKLNEDNQFSASAKSVATVCSSLPQDKSNQELNQTNRNGNQQHIVTLHRGLLHDQWSSSSSLEGGMSIDEIKPLAPTNTSSHSDITKGLILAIIGAGVMYGLTGVFVRLAGENGVGSVETLFVRSVFQSLIFGATSAIKKISFRPLEGKVWFCILIAVCYALATMSSFEAFNVVPPGNAIATRGASRTVFAILFAFLITHESILLKDIIAVITCVTGIACIIASSLTSTSEDYVVPKGMSDNRVIVNVYGYVLIVFAGITRSLGMVTVRRLKGSLHSFMIVFYHSTLTMVVAIFLFFVRPIEWPPTVAGVAYTLAVCFTSSLATWSSNSAVQLIHPALAALGQNSDLVVSIVLEHTLMQLVPSVLEILGACLILGGVSGLTWIRWRESKNES